MSKEKWIPYKGLIEVSNLGRVKSLDRIQLQNNRWGKTMRVLHKGKPLKPYLKKTGYYEIGINNGKEKEYKSIHRLVGILFCPIPEHLKGIPLSKLQVDHIDGNKLNNRADNLRWTTPKENSNNPTTLQKLKEKMKTDDYKKNLKEGLKKRNYHHSEEVKNRISLSNSKKVYQYTLDGTLVQIWDSLTKCDKYGFKIGAISSCCKNKYIRNGNNVYKGYKWSSNPL